MKNFILISLPLSLLLSCAQTKINSESKKAVHWPSNDNIVSNEQIHEASFWTRQYNVERAFPENKEVQEKLEEANKFRRYEAYSLWGMIAASIYYSNNNQDNFDTRRNNSNLIFLAGVVPAIYFLRKGHDKVDEAVNQYNKEKSYSVYPAIQQINQHSETSIVFSTSF